MGNKTKVFSLTALTEQDINDQNISMDLLWYLKVGEKVDGPYTFETIINCIKENKDFIYVKASKTKDGDWMQIKMIDEFMGHKETVKLDTIDIDTLENIKTVSPTAKIFYAMVEGLQSGPFTSTEIVEKVKTNELLYSSLVSRDRGETWHKLYEHPEFKRTPKHENVSKLPEIPEIIIFQNYLLHYDVEEQENENALTRLAFSRKTKDFNGEDTGAVLSKIENIPEEPTEAPTFFKWIASVAAVFVVVMFSANYFTSDNTSTDKTITKIDEVKMEDSQINTNSKTAVPSPSRTIRRAPIRKIASSPTHSSRIKQKKPSRRFFPKRKIFTNNTSTSQDFSRDINDRDSDFDRNELANDIDNFENSENRVPANDDAIDELDENIEEEESFEEAKSVEQDLEIDE